MNKENSRDQTKTNPLDTSPSGKQCNDPNCKFCYALRMSAVSMIRELRK